MEKKITNEDIYAALVVIVEKIVDTGKPHPYNFSLTKQAEIAIENKKKQLFPRQQ